MSKDVAEKVIINSLDSAISDFAKARKVARIKEVLPESFPQVIEVLETETSVMPENNIEMPEALEMPEKKQEKIKQKTKVKSKISKNSKRSSKINTFLAKVGKSKHAEVLSKNKNKKKVKGTVFSKFTVFRKIGNYYNLQKRNLATTVLVSMMLAFVSGATYVTYAYVSTSDGDLVAKVSKHVVVPATETPKVYIVQSEKADIFQNPSFKGIQVGDNVLTYSLAGKVIIYRGSEDKIVNIVNLSQ